MIKFWSSTQQLVALSNGEAELYALIKGASQTKGIISMLMDFGLTFDGTVSTYYQRQWESHFEGVKAARAIWTSNTSGFKKRWQRDV